MRIWILHLHFIFYLMEHLFFVCYVGALSLDASSLPSLKQRRVELPLHGCSDPAIKIYMQLMDILAGCHVTRPIPRERCFSLSVSSANQWGQASIWQLYHASGLVKKLQRQERLFGKCAQDHKTSPCSVCLSGWCVCRTKDQDVVVNQVPRTQTLATAKPMLTRTHSQRQKNYIFFSFPINTELYHVFILKNHCSTYARSVSGAVMPPIKYTKNQRNKSKTLMVGNNCHCFSLAV